MMSSSSSRMMMMSTNTMTGPTNDVDFSFGAMQAAAAQPYAGFDAAGAMAAMPSVERPPPLLQHHHHNSHLYDSFDLAAAGFPFQEPGLLPPASLPLPPSMELAAMPPSPLQMPLPGLLAAAEVYPFGGAAAFLKREDGGHHHQLVDAGGGGTIGLNLGRRTYFSPADVLAVDRLLTRSRLGGGGVGLGVGVLGLGLGDAHHHHHQQQPPRCQGEGCKADLSAAKHYHRRHKVCEYHAKAATVAAAGKQQRFCQQCSRFHVLAEFDDAKRSCRKRLTEHNRRRRKPAGAQGKDSPPPPPKRAADTCIISTSYSSDHHKSASATAEVKSTALSPTNGSGGVSCLDAVDNGHTSSAAAPTALSLAALPPLHDEEKDGGSGLDSMLMRQVQVRDDHDDDDHRRFMTSLAMQQQEHQHDGGSGGHGGHDGVGGGGNILSCPPVSDHRNGGCNGFFEMDFI